jgi:hypothetical protein
MSKRLLVLGGLSFCVFLLAPAGRVLAQGEISDLLSAIPDTGGAFDARVSFKPGCVFGDADAINLDFELVRLGQVNHVKNPADIDPKVVISLEPILADSSGNDTTSAVQATTPTGSSVEDVKVSFKVPDTHGRTEMFVLNVCIAHTKDGATSCRNKVITPFSEIFKNHQVSVSMETGEETAAPPQRPIDERLYYARPIIVKDGKAYILSRGLTKDDYPIIKQRLSQMGMLPEPADKALVELKRLGELGSVALAPYESGIDIPLPFYKADKCFESGQ